METPALVKTKHTIVIGDSRNMRELEAESIHLVVTSPPYWSLKEYGKNEHIGFDQAYEQYIDDISQVLKETSRVLKPGRFACLVVGTAVSDVEMKSIPADIIRVMKELGFTFKKEILWVKPKGVQGLWQRGTTQFLKTKPYPLQLNLNIVHEYILIFQKQGTPDINLDEKRDERLSEDFIKKVAWSVWELDVSKIKGHPAPYPEELVRRLTMLYSFKGETVLDPFLGSGTTARVARQLFRDSMGYEINPEYLGLVMNQLSYYDSPLSQSEECEIQVIIRGQLSVEALIPKKMSPLGPETSLLTLRNVGNKPIEIIGYSIGESGSMTTREFESMRDPPLQIQPNSLGDLPIVDYKFHSGKSYELVLRTKEKFELPVSITA